MPRGRFSLVLLVLLTASAAANVALWRSGLALQESARGLAAGLGDADAWRVNNDANQTAAGGVFDTGASVDDDVVAGAKLDYLRGLEDEHLQGAREIADGYWSADGAFQSAYARALGDGLAWIRADFASRFGAGVELDPAFRWLYRPLDPLHWYLSSEQQLAIQALRLERDEALQTVARDAARTAGRPGFANGGTVDEAAARAIVERYQAGLAALLDPDTLLEFELRDSAVAQQLRASGVDLTESEFRQAYALIAALPDGTANPDDAAASRERLRDLLGNRRYAALWASRDPMFAEISAIAARHALPDAVAQSAYEITSEFRDRRLELSRSAGRNPDRAARDALALADEERAALARVAGEDVADEIVRGRALLSYRLFGSAGPPQPGSDSSESQGGRFR